MLKTNVPTEICIYEIAYKQVFDSYLTMQKKLKMLSINHTVRGSVLQALASVETRFFSCREKRLLVSSVGFI